MGLREHQEGEGRFRNKNSGEEGEGKQEAASGP